MTVYLDEVFLVNLLMDFAVLWCAAHLARFSYSWKRLIAGALCGGLYAVIIFLPFGKYLAGKLGMVLCSLLMIIISFRPKNIKSFCKATAYLYSVAFVMGGAVMAAMYFWGEGFIQTWNGIAIAAVDFRLIWLSFGLLAAIGLVCFLKRPIQHDLSVAAHIVKVDFALNGIAASMQALVDTGSALTEPLSKKPVIVAEFNCIQQLLPLEIVRLYHSLQAPTAEQLLLAAENTPLATKARLIPYRSIGQENGILLGFRPDWLTIQDGNEKFTAQAIVAVSAQSLSPYGTYQGLVNPDLLYR